jgi:hypothetical protein
VESTTPIREEILPPPVYINLHQDIDIEDEGNLSEMEEKKVLAAIINKKYRNDPSR